MGAEMGPAPQPTLLARAIQVFGDREMAERWWHKPNPVLDWQSPERCALELNRSQEVEDILGRIVHGVIS